MPAIYAIQNAVNEQMYIGSAYHPSRRWTRHKSLLRKGMHHSERLQRAWAKYGERAFNFNIVEYVDVKSATLDREQVWIGFFKPAYNMARVAGSPTAGMKFSEETRAKMSAAHAGIKRPPRSPEWIEKIAASKRGKAMSEEAKESMRAKKAARFADPEYRKQWAAIRIASMHSPESVAKRGTSLRGNQNAKGFKHAPEAYASRRGPRKAKESAPRQ